VNEFSGSEEDLIILKRTVVGSVKIYVVTDYSRIQTLQRNALNDEI
jgi:hypothetical protein